MASREQTRKQLEAKDVERQLAMYPLYCGEVKKYKLSAEETAKLIQKYKKKGVSDSVGKRNAYQAEFPD